MRKYILGLDGGGTKTHMALFNSDAEMIDLVEWGPTNHEVMKDGFSELREEMEKLISHILNKNSLEVQDLASCVFGMAGVDTRKQHEIISGIIREIGIQNFILCNDAYLGVKAGCPSGVGICVINGTGSTIAGINAKGEMLQIGGQGKLTRDPGGGSNLGLAAITRVYDYLFRLDSHTIMADIMFEELNISSKHDFMEAVTAGIDNKTLQVKELGKMVFEVANMDDQGAIDILEDVGRALGKSVNGAIHELKFGGLDVIEVVLAGSVNVKGSNPSLVNAIQSQVTSRNPDKKFNFIVLEEPPVAGAVIWALESVYKQKDLFERVIRQF